MASAESRADLEELDGVSPLSNLITIENKPISYQVYKFSKLEQTNIYNTVLPELAAEHDPNTLIMNPGFIEFLKDRGISGDALATYSQTNMVAGTNSQAYLDYIAYNQYLSDNISRYEQEILFPVVFKPVLTRRPAVLRLANIQFGPDVKNPDGTLTRGPTTRPAGYSGLIYADIIIADPGEGFYLLDANGNIKPYVSHVPPPATTTYVTSGGVVLTMQDIELVGRYLYDSPDPTKTAVKGLSKFKHRNMLLYGTTKVQMQFAGGAELNGQTFTISPPVYSQMQSNVVPLQNGPRTIVLGTAEGRATGTDIAGRAARFERSTVTAQVGGNRAPPAVVKPPPFDGVPADLKSNLIKENSAKFDFVQGKARVANPQATPPAPSGGPSSLITEEIPLRKPATGKPVLSNPRPALTIKTPPPPPPALTRGAGFRGPRPPGLKPPPVPKPALTRGTGFRLPSPNVKIVPVNGWGKVLGVIGVALTIMATVQSIEEVVKQRGPATDCTGVSSNNR
jgi:hypothetical protein